VLLNIGRNFSTFHCQLRIIWSSFSPQIAFFSFSRCSLRISPECAHCLQTTGKWAKEAKLQEGEDQERQLRIYVRASIIYARYLQQDVEALGCVNLYVSGTITGTKKPFPLSICSRNAQLFSIQNRGLLPSHFKRIEIKNKKPS
jgi:hypothetical protein